MQNFQVKIMLDFIIVEPLSKPRLYQFTVDTKSSGYILNKIPSPPPVANNVNRGKNSGIKKETAEFLKQHHFQFCQLHIECYNIQYWSLLYLL